MRSPDRTFRVIGVVTVLFLVVGFASIHHDYTVERELKAQSSYHVQYWANGGSRGRHLLKHCYATELRREGGRLKLRSARTGYWLDWPADRCTITEYGR